ncbi:diaminopimelate decarboxylase [Pseudochrobactrum sp. HB0163]|uniref:diaminopimelate decarboxylase n=1 Tax=Pseudochrobactrum sp. HB0163 TaxID=3450708 RepID=UPI003F6DFDE4
MTTEFSRPHVAYFGYKNGELAVENVAISAIAAKYGTPFYVYSAAAVRERVAKLRAALDGLDIQICYAVKANNNLSLLSLLVNEGCGMDIVSDGEMQRALTAGAPAGKIVFSGVGKTDEEIAAALNAGVHQLNVESIEELDAISRVAGKIGKVATVVLRVNPDVDALTHPKITTGTSKNKFGIAYADAVNTYAAAAARKEINMVGIAVHIGSQITDVAPFRQTFERLAQLTQAIRAKGLTISRLDLGGGLGVSYDGSAGIDVIAYAQTIRETLGDSGCALTIEPGRFIIAEAGALVAKVLYGKNQGNVKFSIVDAAMNDLMRPALYDALHPVWPVREPAADAEALPVHLVGPVCESSDTFGEFDHLPALERGDLVMLGVAGAYGATMSSTYNARPLIQEVLVEGDSFRLVRRQWTVEDALALERDL